jgi:cytochrome c553
MALFAVSAVMGAPPVASHRFTSRAEVAQTEYDEVMQREANLDNGRRVYLACAVCHLPEGWGSVDGSYPQIAGQLRTVIIKQLADFRAGNRDNPLMYPFSVPVSSADRKRSPMWPPMWRSCRCRLTMPSAPATGFRSASNCTPTTAPIAMALLARVIWMSIFLPSPASTILI